MWAVGLADLRSRVSSVSSIITAPLEKVSDRDVEIQFGLVFGKCRRVVPIIKSGLAVCKRGCVNSG